MKRNALLSNTDVWNAVTKVLSEYDLSTEDILFNEAFIVYQYYSELESGGHESLFNWFEWYISKVGIEQYLHELISIFEKIAAHDYALIMKNYGKEMWRLFVALENGEINEDEFYLVIQKADSDYYKLNGELANLLAKYFIAIYTNLIDIIEE